MADGRAAPAVTIARWMPDRLPGAAHLALQAAALAVLVVFVIARLGSNEAVDAHIYWAARVPDLYEPVSRMGDQHYHYSPAFAQALAPATALPFAAFQAGLLLLQLLVLLWLVGPIIAAAALLIPFTNLQAELVLGNIHLLLAAAVVIGFRWPAAWALPLLTKVTPGVGIVWYAARREWRHLAIACGVTAVIALVSFVLLPGAWMEWITWLASNPPTPSNPDQLMAWAPLWGRLIASAGLIVVAARANARWLLPVAVWLALPVIWYNSLPLLLAVIPLARAQRGDLSNA